MGWGGKEGEGWGKPRACGCPAPGQWTARTAPPIPLRRDRICLGPGGCPLLPLPTRFLFVPKSWGHLPLALFVKCGQENQRELGLLPGGEAIWGLQVGAGGLLRASGCLSRKGETRGCCFRRAPMQESRRHSEGDRLGGRRRQCSSCVLKGKSVALDSPSSLKKPFPSMSAD